MGFGPKNAVESALKQSKGSIENAIALLSSGDYQPMEVDEPSSVLDAASSPNSKTTNESSSSSSGGNTTSQPDQQVRSWRCKETGKMFKSMADVQIYAERTNRGDFEETTVLIKPRTEEELKADQAKLKVLIKKKQAENAEKEKK